MKDLGLGIKYNEEEEEYELDGICHSDLANTLQCGVLNMCGCGLPFQNLVFIAKGLEVASRLNRTDGLKFEDWQKAYREYFGSEDGAYFFFYYANKEEFMEHGGSVPGWLTDKGKKFIELVNKVIEEDGESEEYTGGLIQL